MNVEDRYGADFEMTEDRREIMRLQAERQDRDARLLDALVKSERQADELELLRSRLAACEEENMQFRQDVRRLGLAVGDVVRVDEAVERIAALRGVERRALDMIAAQDEIAASGSQIDERALGVRRAVFRILGIDYRPVDR